MVSVAATVAALAMLAAAVITGGGDGGNGGGNGGEGGIARIFISFSPPFSCSFLTRDLTFLVLYSIYSASLSFQRLYHVTLVNTCI